MTSASLSHHRKGTNDLEWDYDAAPADDIATGGGDCDSVNELPAYDRREMRRRLSLDSDHEEEIGSQISARIRRSILRERMNQRQNLQICFMQDDITNTDIDDDSGDEAGNENDHHAVVPMQTSGYSAVSGQENEDRNQISSVSKSSDQTCDKQCQSNGNILTQWFGSFSSKSSVTESIRKNFSSFDEYHKHIHTEAKKALKSAKECARMQMMLEKQQNKATRVLGVHPGDGLAANVTEDPLTHSVDELKSMTRMKLRLLITKIVNKTEQLNGALLKMLEERDELHMEQDSLLVDIQDLTQFLNSKS
jgi:hypothetical protein